MDIMNKYQQERKTHIDCLNAQIELVELVRSKIDHPILSKIEASRIPRLTAQALISRGASYKFTLPWTSEDGKRSAILKLGSLHSILLFMEDYAVSYETTIICYGEKYRVKVSDLWRQIYKDLKAVYPSALSEAHQRSREFPVKEPTSAYSFDIKGDNEKW